MRNVTSDYLAQVKSGARQFGFMVQVQSGAGKETLLLADIISIDITRSISDQLQIGACMSDRLTLQTKATSLFNERGKKIWVYYRCTEPILDWVLLGTFYVDECVTERGITAVIAYDMMSRLDKKVRWIDVSTATAPTFPCTMQDMLDYLCDRARVTTDFVCQNITVEKPPDGYTARELISYIAASHGGNARFSPSEVLQIRPYTQTSQLIKYGDCYSLDVASDNGYEVKGILFDRGGDDKIYIDGTSAEYDEDADGVVQAFNPFATVGIAEYAWDKLGGLNYSAVSLEMPATNIFEPGDVITVQKSDDRTATAIVMEQVLSVSCTGGFVEKISCTAQSKSQERSANNRMEQTEAQVSEGGGDTFNDAIILTQGDLPYLLHSYSVVEYRKNWLIVSPGPDANIIINNCIAYSAEVIDATAVIYTSLSFYAAKSLSTAPIQHTIDIRITQSGRESDGTPYNTVNSYDNGSALAGQKTYGTFGLALSFGVIYAPNDVFVNGYAAINVWLIYQDKSGTLIKRDPRIINYLVGFGSIAEYHAAIKLTKEPLTDYEVIETTVTDDGNSTLEKAMMYTDKVAETLQESITNISESDREQIAQNASDIAAHDVRITAVEGEVDTINAPSGGILSQSKAYTDFVADELRGEFGK